MKLPILAMAALLVVSAPVHAQSMCAPHDRLMSTLNDQGIRLEGGGDVPLSEGYGGAEPLLCHGVSLQNRLRTMRFNQEVAFLVLGIENGVHFSARLHQLRHLGALGSKRGLCRLGTGNQLRDALARPCDEAGVGDVFRPRLFIAVAVAA